MASTAYADIYTESTDTSNFALPYVVRGFRGWDDNLNNAIVSIDSVLGILSDDSGGQTIGIISDDMSNLTEEVNIISDDMADIYDGTNLIGNINSTTISGDNLGVDGQYTFPTDAPTAGLPILSYDVTTGTVKWSADTGGSSSVGGVDTNVQYNNNGVIDGFGAWDDSNNALTISTQPAFSAKLAAYQTDLPPGTTKTISFDTVHFDQGSDFNSGTYTFTAPVTGKYLMCYNVGLGAIDTAATNYTFNLVTSNRTYENVQYFDQFAADVTRWYTSASYVVDMDATDTASVSILQSGGGQQTDVISNSWFSGSLLN